MAPDKPYVRLEYENVRRKVTHDDKNAFIESHFADLYIRIYKDPFGKELSKDKPAYFIKFDLQGTFNTQFSDWMNSSRNHKSTQKQSPDSLINIGTTNYLFVKDELIKYKYELEGIFDKPNSSGETVYEKYVDQWETNVNLIPSKSYTILPTEPYKIP